MASKITNAMFLVFILLIFNGQSESFSIDDQSKVYCNRLKDQDPKCFVAIINGSSSIVCNNFNSLSEINLDCSNVIVDNQPQTLYLDPNEPILFDRFDLIRGFETIRIKNIKGFELSSENSSSLSRFLDIRIEDSTFNFYYSNGSLIETKEDCNNISTASFFGEWSSLTLKNIRFDTKLCPLLVASLKYLKIENSASSIDFHPIWRSYRSNLIWLEFSGSTFDANLVNYDLFKNVMKITIDSESIDSLDSISFERLKQLKMLELSRQTFSEIYEKYENRWLLQINRDLKRMESFDSNYVRENMFRIQVKSVGDESFCRVKDFPHERLIVIDTGEEEEHEECSCTYLFLTIHLTVSQVEQGRHRCLRDQNKHIRSLLKCDFGAQISGCNNNSSNGSLEKIDYKSYVADLIGSMIGKHHIQKRADDDKTTKKHHHHKTTKNADGDEDSKKTTKKKHHHKTTTPDPDDDDDDGDDDDKDDDDDDDDKDDDDDEGDGDEDDEDEYGEGKKKKKKKKSSTVSVHQNPLPLTVLLTFSSLYICLIKRF